MQMKPKSMTVVDPLFAKSSLLAQIMTSNKAVTANILQRCHILHAKNVKQL